MKCILLLYSDPLLARIHRERLEAAGCEIALAADRVAALRLLEARRIDLVVIDLLRAQGDGLDLALALKGTTNGRYASFLALPGAPKEISSAAAQVGIPTVQISLEPRARDPRHALFDAMDRTLGRDAGTLTAVRGGEAVEKNWRKACLEGVVEEVATLRKEVLGVAQAANGTGHLESALLAAHRLAHRGLEAGLLPLHQLAAGLARLLHELLSLPESLNASTLRTLSQAVDFLGVLIEPKALAAQHKLQPGLVYTVDDDPLTNRAITASLATAGLQTRSAGLPSTALKALENLQCDLIILDIGLPEMNGFELCKQLRAQPQHQKTPIIFLTGLATFQNKVQSSLVSGCDFMAKPFNVFELPVKVTVWMYRSRLALI